MAAMAQEHTWSPVIIGQDDGANVQIVSGLNASDQVIQDPPDS